MQRFHLHSTFVETTEFYLTRSLLEIAQEINMCMECYYHRGNENICKQYSGLRTANGRLGMSLLLRNHFKTLNTSWMSILLCGKNGFFQ